jgi:hypothetical protein
MKSTNEWRLWSISPTFYKQLFRRFPCAKKIKPKLNEGKAASLTFKRKSW